MKNRARLLILICLLILACAVAIAVYGYWANEPYPDPFTTSTEGITYTSYRWGTNDGSVTLTVENTGPVNLTIASIQIDGVSQSSVSPALGSRYQLAKGASQAFNITHTFISGEQYNFMFVTAKGNQFGPYTLTAP
jgi:P pilus assembly chaperone PapD